MKRVNPQRTLHQHKLFKQYLRRRKLWQNQSYFKDVGGQQKYQYINNLSKVRRNYSGLPTPFEELGGPNQVMRRYFDEHEKLEYIFPLVEK